MPYTFKYGDRPLEGITIHRAVGRGGFGEVYYAVTDSGKQIALKYLRENPEIELRGIGHVMNLKSPHLITIYDVRFNAAGEPFVLMEYVAGPSLRELLLAEPQGFSPQKAAFFLDGIVRGLSYLHQRGIVHRDLKPANIFYDDGYVKIGDYGLSKHISVSRHSGQTVSVGTVHYMAPEIGSGSYTKAIDIYALGVILYEMLTGRVPFSGASMGEILMRHLADRPDLAGVPEPFAGIIARALAKDPADRFQDVNEMADAVRRHPGLCAAIEAFDPTTLTQVPRRPEASDEPTAPGPTARPALDARMPASVQQRLERAAAKAEKKIQKIARKIERKAQKLGSSHDKWRTWERSVPSASGPQPRRRTQVFVLLLLIVGIGLGLSFIGPQSSQAERALALAFGLAGATAGPLLAYFYLLRRLPWRGGLWERVVYVAVTAALLTPAYGIASQTRAPDNELARVLRQRLERTDTGGSERQVRWSTRRPAQSDRFAQVLVAPLAALAICNWTRRIEVGRTGRITGGQVFWPAVVGLVAAGIADAEEYHWVAAGFCAAMAFLVQAGATLWSGAALSGAPEHSLAAAQASGPAPAEVVGTSARSTESAPPAQPAAAGTVVIETGTSVFGWTLSTGLALVGRLLVAAGLILGLGQEPLRRWLSAESVAGLPGAYLVAEALDTQVLIATLLGGSALLILSRAKGGSLHVARGIGGCAALLWAVLAARGPAAGAVAALLSASAAEPAQLAPDFGPAVAKVLIPLVVGLVLLAWPPRQEQAPVIV